MIWRMPTIREIYSETGRMSISFAFTEPRDSLARPCIQTTQTAARVNAGIADFCQNTRSKQRDYPRLDSTRLSTPNAWRAGFFNIRLVMACLQNQSQCASSKKSTSWKIEQELGRQKLLEAVNADRKCKSWYPYIPGLSPIEHFEDMQMRAYENRMEQERIAREASYRRQDRALVIAGLILAAGQILAALIISYRESFTDQLMRRLFGH